MNFDVLSEGFSPTHPERKLVECHSLEEAIAYVEEDYWSDTIVFPSQELDEEFDKLFWVSDISTRGRLHYKRRES